MKINTNVWKIVLRFGFRRVFSGLINNANWCISVLTNLYYNLIISYLNSLIIKCKYFRHRNGLTRVHPKFLRSI